MSGGMRQNEESKNPRPQDTFTRAGAFPQAHVRFDIGSDGANLIGNAEDLMGELNLRSPMRQPFAAIENQSSGGGLTRSGGKKRKRPQRSQYRNNNLMRDAQSQNVQMTNENQMMQGAIEGEDF